MITYIRDPALAATVQTFIEKKCRNTGCGSLTGDGTFAVATYDEKDRGLLKGKFPEVAWKF
jgi:hypothetical protein